VKIGIIGLGFVGLSFSSVLSSKGFDIIGIDVDKEKLKTIKLGKSPFFEPKIEETLQKALKKKLMFSDKIEDAVNNCDLIFVTVGTPMNLSGNIDLRIILNVCKKIGESLSKTQNKPHIIIKSTVIPGTTINKIKKKLEVASNKKEGDGFTLITNPEFLREGRAIEDTLKPHLIVIGSNSEKSSEKLRKFYEKTYGEKIPIIVTNNTTAELIKYANNSFLATKISFINNIANLCQTLPGTNVDIIAKAIGIDPRIGQQFLNAGPGYGGSCLPKDVQAMMIFQKKSGQESVLLNAVHQTNVLQINKIINLIEKSIGNIRNKQISILGLSFKEKSDDVRESISIKLIKILLKKQAKIKVHDPKAIKNTKTIFGNKIRYHNKIKDALEDTQCTVIMTPWKQYSNLKNSDFDTMKKKIIIDTRRILNLNNNDLTYIGLGVGS
jgi:UDPglucose 6-dehydrogenase